MLEHIDIARFRGSTVGVLLGGDSNERAVSLKTGEAFVAALEALDYDVRAYDLPAALPTLIDDRPKAVIVALHGGKGESGAVQGMLEMLEIPYTGSDPLASALALDKARTKALLQHRRIPVPEGVFVHAADFDRDAAQTYRRAIPVPCVVKANDAGSSVGVYLCEDESGFEKAVFEVAEHLTDSPSSGVLFEEWIAGPEYSVGLFDGVALGAIEIRPESGFYDFEAKYEKDTTTYIPVEDNALLERLQTLGLATYRALGCKGVARIDLIGEDGELKVLEANTVPGMTSTSLVPKMAAALGMDFSEFTERMLASAHL